MKNDFLAALSKEQLIEIIELYAKNWLALDGVWFQSLEDKLGMLAAMEHDARAWQRFTVIEARRIKQFLQLPEYAGLSGLRDALCLRFYANINESQIFLEDRRLIYKMKDCRVQTARKRKQMPYHPCKPVGIIEYSGFAKVIYPRISCQCLSCYPDIEDESCSCSWLFTIDD